MCILYSSFYFIQKQLKILLNWYIAILLRSKWLDHVIMTFQLVNMNLNAPIILTDSNWPEEISAVIFNHFKLLIETKNSTGNTFRRHKEPLSWTNNLMKHVCLTVFVCQGGRVNRLWAAGFDWEDSLPSRPRLRHLPPAIRTSFTWVAACVPLHTHFH